MKLYFSSLLASLVASRAAAEFDYSMNLNLAVNNSWFSWNRPKFHMIAPNSWMNDPCAAYYDPTTDEYQIFYQYHNAHVHWGNISFAGAKSQDLIFYEDYNSWEDPTAIGTDQPYGPAQLGVFSGSALVDGYKGYPTIMYTSVQRLPISWKINYQPLSETQSIAYTPDNGTTWIKLNDINPVIPAPPEDYNITGWRDTLVFRGTQAFHAAIGNHTINTIDTGLEVEVSKAGNGLRGRKLSESITGENGIFTIISSGIKGDGPEAGPKVLLYEAVEAEPGSDKVMTDWKFLGPLFAPAPNTSFSEWSGNWGYNFEMAGYFPLQDKEEEMHFITLGSEGGRPGSHADHWPLWLGGSITPEGDSPTLVPEMAGVLDYGEVYAINTFLDKNNERVMLAWTYEDDGGYGMQARGWQGSLLLPRHLSVYYLENVVTESTDEEMTQPSDFVATKNDDGTWTIKTLGIVPIPAVEKLRDGAARYTYDATTPALGYQKIAALATNHFELEFQINLVRPDSKAGIAIRRSEDGSETTNIYYDHATQAVYVDRSKSSPFKEFNNETEVAKFRLWEQEDSGLEALNVRLFADGSVVEVYINDRFALTTRIYPSEESREIGYYSEEATAEYSDVEVYDGLANAWPNRPEDSSIPLVWDGEPYTQYWPGY